MCQFPLRSISRLLRGHLNHSIRLLATHLCSHRMASASKSDPSESDYEEEDRRRRESNAMAAAARRRTLANRRGSAPQRGRGRPTLRRPPQRRHDGEAGSSWAAASPQPPPPAAAFTESSDDDESYSSLESLSTDDGADLLKIVDQVELDARVFTKSVRSERRAEKRRCFDAKFEEVMNDVRLKHASGSTRPAPP